MLRSIVSIACGVVLLCSTAWANESNNEQAAQLEGFFGIWEFTIGSENPTTIWYVFDNVVIYRDMPILEGRNIMTQEKISMQPIQRDLEGYSAEARKMMSENDFTASSSIRNAQEKEVLCSMYYLKLSKTRSDEPPRIDGHFVGLFTPEDKATKWSEIAGTECLTFDHKVEGKFVGVKHYP